MMKIFLSEEALSLVKNNHIFVDTCVFLDLASLRKGDRGEFENKLLQFTKRGSIFVTVEPVAVEFYLGSSQSDLKIKKSYINQLIESTLPVRVLNKSKMDSLILEYGRNARGNVSYADLCLGAAIKQFPNSLVLTRNHRDFPLKIFDSKAVFTVHLNIEARTYCFYGYRGMIKKHKKKRETKKADIPF